jgi:cytochrome c oxidase subunit III
MTQMTAERVTGKQAWGGGVAPYNISWGKMMMWFFLVSDALTFSSLLIYYAAQRSTYQGDKWAQPDIVFSHFPFVSGHVPLLFVSLMTFILIMSSVTMVLAVEAGHRFHRKGVIIWLALTIVGGFMFLGSQAYEWTMFITGTPEGKVIPVEGGLGHIIVQGANLIQNEYGPPQYANLFFFITGFHGSHVLSGVVINIIVLIMVIRGVFDRRGHYEMVEKVGLYWHFVDLVWVFVFTFFYLI